jgi:hypothetical protein
MLQSSQPPAIPVAAPTSTATLATGSITGPALSRKMPFASGWSLHVTVYIAPENVDSFLAAFKPVFDKVVAEPECLFFEMYLSPQEPGKISWVENWLVSVLRCKAMDGKNTNHVIGQNHQSGSSRWVQARLGSQHGLT